MGSMRNTSSFRSPQPSSHTHVKSKIRAIVRKPFSPAPQLNKRALNRNVQDIICIFNIFITLAMIAKNTKLKRRKSVSSDSESDSRSQHGKRGELIL